MTTSNRVPTTPEGLAPGDKFLFNDRTEPCTVECSTPVDAYDGSIHITHFVFADAPRGGRLWLQRTGTGRIRVKHSPPWCAAQNVYSLERVGLPGVMRGKMRSASEQLLSEIHDRTLGVDS